MKHVETTKTEVVTFLLEATSSVTSGHRTAQWGLPPRQISNPRRFPPGGHKMCPGGLNIFNLTAVTWGSQRGKLYKYAWHTKKSRRSHKLRMSLIRLIDYLAAEWYSAISCRIQRKENAERCSLPGSIYINMSFTSWSELLTAGINALWMPTIRPNSTWPQIARDRKGSRSVPPVPRWHPASSPTICSALSTSKRTWPRHFTPTTSLEATITKPWIYKIGRNRTKIGASWSLSLSPNLTVLRKWHYRLLDLLATFNDIPMSFQATFNWGHLPCWVVHGVFVLRWSMSHLWPWRGMAWPTCLVSRVVTSKDSKAGTVKKMTWTPKLLLCPTAPWQISSVPGINCPPRAACCLLHGHNVISPKIEGDLLGTFATCHELHICKPKTHWNIRALVYKSFLDGWPSSLGKWKITNVIQCSDHGTYQTLSRLRAALEQEASTPFCRCRVHENLRRSESNRKPKVMSLLEEHRKAWSNEHH